MQRVQQIDVRCAKLHLSRKQARRHLKIKNVIVQDISLSNKKSGLRDTCIVFMETKNQTGQLTRQSCLQRATPQIKCQL